MNPFEMVLGIVLIVMVASVLKARYRVRDTDSDQRPDADALRLREEVQRLRERIQVLERVITDQHQSSDLDREIARLRDQ